jgi:hypothetical protein
MMTDDPMDQILTRLRAICLALPDAHEEHAWVGIRWRIRITAPSPTSSPSTKDGHPPTPVRPAPTGPPRC